MELRLRVEWCCVYFLAIVENLYIEQGVRFWVCKRVFTFFTGENAHEKLRETELLDQDSAVMRIYPNRSGNGNTAQFNPLITKQRLVHLMISRDSSVYRTQPGGPARPSLLFHMCKHGLEPRVSSINHPLIH